jgi:YidC/Oxa1 family membrane protein insertase
MDFLTLGSLMLDVAKPTGMWESIVFGLETLVKNYGLTIILVTLAIKLVLLPFDFYNRYINKRNSSKMAIIQPEIEKIQKKYGANRDVVNQKTMEVYKKHNYNVMGSCLGMLLNMVLTMVVFFTLFSGLNKIASYKIYTEYATLQTTYEQTIGGTLVEVAENEQKVIKVKLEDETIIDLTDEKENAANLHHSSYGGAHLRTFSFCGAQTGRGFFRKRAQTP